MSITADSSSSLPARRHTTDEVIHLPVTQVTACTFGGPDLGDLYITTSRQGIDGDSEPAAGSIYTARPGTTGLPTTPYAGLNSRLVIRNWSVLWDCRRQRLDEPVASRAVLGGDELDADSELGGTERTVACQPAPGIARQNAQGARRQMVVDRCRPGNPACTQRPPRRRPVGHRLELRRSRW